LPDGGELLLKKFWIPIGPRTALEVPVDEIMGFKYEMSEFQDSDEDKYTLARLWVLRNSGNPRKLTDWMDPDTVNHLGDALSKACRCEYNQGELTAA
jgi:hypothetical protein